VGVLLTVPQTAAINPQMYPHTAADGTVQYHGTALEPAATAVGYIN